VLARLRGHVPLVDDETTVLDAILTFF